MKGITAWVRVLAALLLWLVALPAQAATLQMEADEQAFAVQPAGA